MAGVGADLGQRLEPVPLTDDDERPALQVLGAAGPASGIKDAAELGLLDRSVREAADDADRVDGRPGVHARQSGSPSPVASLGVGSRELPSIGPTP
jgi:hypothetical protein